MDFLPVGLYFPTYPGNQRRRSHRGDVSPFGQVIIEPEPETSRFVDRVDFTLAESRKDIIQPLKVRRYGSIMDNLPLTDGCQDR